MSSNNRVVWSEGLFLRPQHFQQQERYFERYVEGRGRALRSHSWGIVEIEIERDLLAIGKFGLRRVTGIFPDGTPFSLPDDGPLPQALELNAQVRDERVFLALPLRKDGVRQAARPGAQEGLARYQVGEFDVRDIATDSSSAATMEVGALRARLMLSREAREDFACIPIAHIQECRADRLVILDDRFIPTVMSCRQSTRLATFLTELQGLLHQRGEALAAVATASGRSGAAEVAGFLMLQAVNRYEPVIDHYVAAGLVHPEDLYRLCVEIAGDLSTLTTASRRPAKIPPYDHEDLRVSFEPLIAALRASLSMIIDQPAVSIPLEKKRFNISVGVVNDKALFDTAAFVLAARADVPAEAVRKGLPAQVTIASVETIAKLVNDHVPGVALVAAPVAPRQIPYHAGFSYFELERSSPRFRELKASGGIAIHVPDSFPGLVLELWAIRG